MSRLLTRGGYPSDRSETVFREKVQMLSAVRTAGKGGVAAGDSEGNTWNHEELNPPVVTGLGPKQKRALHHQVHSRTESLKHKRQPNPKTPIPRFRHMRIESITPGGPGRWKGTTGMREPSGHSKELHIRCGGNTDSEKHKPPGPGERGIFTLTVYATQRTLRSKGSHQELWPKEATT